MKNKAVVYLLVDKKAGNSKLRNTTIRYQNALRFIMFRIPFKCQLGLPAYYVDKP